MDELLTYEDVSKVLKRSVSSLRHDCSAGKEGTIPYIKMGTGKSAMVRFRKSDIEAWLEEQVIRSERTQ